MRVPWEKQNATQLDTSADGGWRPARCRAGLPDRDHRRHAEVMLLHLDTDLGGDTDDACDRSWTNLALLEIARPGSLSRAPVVATGGWTGLAAGLPPWGPEMDFNVQWDTRAAEIVAATADLTLIPLPVTLKAHLRAADLPRLRASGPLGELLARQGEAHGHDLQMAQMGRLHAGLPDDLLNFQYDPVACAVAIGWPGAIPQETRLQLVHDGELVRFRPETAGRPMRILTDMDSGSFTEYWPRCRSPADSSMSVMRQDCPGPAS